MPEEPEKPENLILRILQEIRDEMRSRLSSLDESVKDLGQRVDGNTLTFNLVAGVVYDHEQRIAMLEERRLPRR